MKCAIAGTVIQVRRKLVEELSHLLWEYCLENDSTSQQSWPVSCCDRRHYIYYNHISKSFSVNTITAGKNLGGVYFSDKEVAKRAIKTVVEPFYEHHPILSVELRKSSRNRL